MWGSQHTHTPEVVEDTKESGMGIFASLFSSLTFFFQFRVIPEADKKQMKMSVVGGSEAGGKQEASAYEAKKRRRARTFHVP